MISLRTFMSSLQNRKTAKPPCSKSNTKFGENNRKKVWPFQEKFVSL